MEASRSYQAGQRPLMSAGTMTPHSPRNILLREHLNTHYSGCMTTLMSPLYHICIINSRSDTTVCMWDPHIVMQLTPSSSLTCPLAKAECPPWSAWIILRISMAPMGPYDLCSYALVMMALQRREHTHKSDSGRLPE